MPLTELRYYRELDGRVPVEMWLTDIRRQNTKAFRKCIAKIARLRMLGHELRRPEADVLRDGIHELRVRDGRVNYRILYFFHGRNIAILGHAITKTDVVPPIEIERAFQRKRAVETNPKKHIAEEAPDYGTP